MAIDLKSKTVRKQLDPRPAPYFTRLEAGLFLGYRVLKHGDGTWTARKRSEDGVQKTQALGTYQDYDEAAKAARAWAESLSRGVTVFDETVHDACVAYVAELKTRKSAKSSHDTDARFKRLVYGKPIASIKLAKLQTQHIKNWLNAQVADDDDSDEEDVRRSKDSANRNLASFKAALNQAYNDKRVTAKPWETVKPFKDVGKGRTRFITRSDCDALMAHCPDDLAKLVRAMLLTACRPGELAKVEARHFDPRQGTLEITGKTGHRVVSLSTAARLFFAELAADKIGAALLLQRADGLAWDKDWWKKLFTKARKAAKLPDDVVMYSLRHAAISEMIMAGVDVFLIARLAGTSTAMIDKHYGHLNHDKTREILDAAHNRVIS